MTLRERMRELNLHNEDMLPCLRYPSTISGVLQGRYNGALTGQEIHAIAKKLELSFSDVLLAMNDSHEAWVQSNKRKKETT